MVEQIATESFTQGRQIRKGLGGLDDVTTGDLKVQPVSLLEDLLKIDLHVHRRLTIALSDLELRASETGLQMRCDLLSLTHPSLVPVQET